MPWPEVSLLKLPFVSINLLSDYIWADGPSYSLQLFEYVRQAAEMCGDEDDELFVWYVRPT